MVKTDVTPVVKMVGRKVARAKFHIYKGTTSSIVDIRAKASDAVAQYHPKFNMKMTRDRKRALAMSGGGSTPPSDDEYGYESDGLIPHSVQAYR